MHAHSHTQTHNYANIVTDTHCCMQNSSTVTSGDSLCIYHGNANENKVENYTGKIGGNRKWQPISAIDLQIFS